jgi:hypothetical protein
VAPPKSHTSEAIFQDRFRRLALLVATRLDSFDFTATGHAVVLTVGMLLSSRFHSPALDAAAAGVAFGDTALVGVVVTAPIALCACSAVSRGSSCERDRSSVMATADRPHLGTDLGTKFGETAAIRTAFFQQGRLLFEGFAGNVLHHVVGGTRCVGA